MELAAKLRRLPPIKKPPDRLGLLRTKIDEIMTRAPSPAEPVPLPVTPREPLSITLEYLEPDHQHGAVPVARALVAEPSIVAKLALDAELAGVDLSRALFLDTETTGLRSGGGTVAFLIGLGWFEDQSLAVEQLFLEELGFETTMLEHVRSRIEAASCIVTYNGKSYDWPLLETRFVMNRVEPPPVRPHLDLLHCARRIHKKRLGGVRLVDIEERVLGMRRERDVDGAEIPGLYWSFLRHRNPESMWPVLEHNRSDVVALAAMLAHLSQRFSKVFFEDDPLDHFARARLAVRAKDAPRATQFARAAAEGGAVPAVTRDAYLLLGTLARRAGAYAEAERCWLDALEACEGDIELEPPVHLELAKLYEHKIKDLKRALRHARRMFPVEAKRLTRLEKRLRKTTCIPLCGKVNQPTEPRLHKPEKGVSCACTQVSMESEFEPQTRIL